MALQKYEVKVVDSIAQEMKPTTKKIDGTGVQGRTVNGVYNIEVIYIQAENENIAHQILKGLKEQYKIK